MIKIMMPSGHYAYIASAIATFYLGGCGVCDRCNDVTPRGFLVPLHTSYYCPDCYNTLKAQTKYYRESIPFERMVMENWESRIPVLIDATYNE